MLNAVAERPRRATRPGGKRMNLYSQLLLAPKTEDASPNLSRRVRGRNEWRCWLRIQRQRDYLDPGVKGHASRWNLILMNSR